MEQLVILLIIGLISLVNWVMQKAAEKRETAGQNRTARRETKHESRRNVYTQPAPAPAPVARRSTAQRDPFKDLMDALGLPAETAPPGPVVAEPAYFEEEEFASLEDAVPPPVPRTSAPAWQAPARPAKPDGKTAALASAFAAVGEKSAPAYRGSTLQDLLANRDSQRNAIVLAEILGTPRGVAPYRAV
ncbi:MAG: hypothetical protein WD063_00645 [Pirellulales bacterium]